MKFSLWGAMRHVVFSVLAVLGGVTLGAALVGAATTISTNVQTDGTLSVTGASTLTGRTSMVQASSTRLSVFDTAYFGGTATSTFNSAGNLSVIGTLAVTGDTTLASSTATAFKVGQVGTRHTGILSGSCTIAASAHTASTTKQVTCATATGVTTSYKVFVQATSSLPTPLVIQSATSSTDAIEVRIYNSGIATTTTINVDPISLFFWAVL